MEMDKDIIEVLAGVSGEIAAISPSDKEAIVRVGSELEKAFLALPASAESLAELLKLTLLTLQGVYQGDIPDGEGGMQALAEAVKVAHEVAGGQADDEAVDQQRAALTAILEPPAGQDAQDAADAEVAEETAAEAGATTPDAPDDAGDGEGTASEVGGEQVEAGDDTLTPRLLDEIAALLMGLGGEDREELQGVNDRLCGIAAGDSPAPNTAELVQAAVEAIAGVLEGTSDDADASLAAAGDALSKASRELEAVAEEGEAGQDDGQVAAPDAEPPEDAEEGDAGQAESSVEATTEATDETQSDSPVEEPVEAPAETQPDTPAEAPAEPKVEAEAEASKPGILPADSDMELLGEYIIECTDHISAAEAALLTLEANPDDADQIGVVFRAFHTIKGTSGFLGLDSIQHCAHLAENQLDRVREGKIKIVGGYADLTLKTCDALRTMIEGIRGVEPGGELPLPENLDELLEQLENPEAAGIGEDENADPMRVGEILVGRGAAERDTVEEAARTQGDKLIGEKLIESGAVETTDVAKALRTQRRQGGGAVAAPASTIRVGTGRLDSLINMVGELVIAQSMVAQDPDVVSGTGRRLGRNIAHAGKIIRELQDLTMALRMVPLGGTFKKMARLVRDLARKGGKNVRFVTEGEDTEIDRNMVETLNDPLVHMIRNSVDHGIEPPDVRSQTGKDQAGTVKLRAYHAAGNVVIELQDDGKGLDREKIIAKAIERGLVQPGQDISDSEAFGLIFQAGFSTAEKVTDVSGRGVGMDVVRRSIEAIRGRIELSSKKGQGTTVTLRLPLTMAITDAMLLGVGAERFLLPTVSIEQSFRPTSDVVSTVAQKGEMVQLRGELLPIFRLHDLFDIPDAATELSQALLVVIESENRRCALMVDHILGQQQVVIKSLGATFGNVAGVSGGAILGDGHVGLILDAAGLIELTRGRETADAAMATV